MSYDNPNQCGYYEQETVPCDLCGTPTPMTGTRRCDPCWELERRVEQRPEVARKLVAAMDAVSPNSDQEALEAVYPSLDCHCYGKHDRDCVRGKVDAILAAVAKERAL